MMYTLTLRNGTDITGREGKIDQLKENVFSTLEGGGEVSGQHGSGFNSQH